MAEQLERRIALAIWDPGAIVGRKLGPSWGEGQPGYATDEEFVTAWQVRAVHAVFADAATATLAEVERLRALVDVAVWCDCGIGASRDGLCDNSAIASMPHADDCPARDRALAAEVERLRAELVQARADVEKYRDEARRRSNEDLTLRGILSPADRPTARPIPFELGPSLADALNYLVARSEALDKVMLLVEAADPQHHVPADGTLIVATYPDGQEHAFERVDVATVEDGEWWEVGADHPTPYGVILGHDEPPQDRLVVVIEPYVSLAHLRSALDGAS